MKDIAAASSELKLRVLEELRHVLETGFAGASERQRSLLHYLVTEEIESRGPRIKAYNIATEVFGRPSDFDPQLDSIVRVEVARLRQALELHYLTAGAGAPLTITIPKGQYRPSFAEAGTAAAETLSAKQRSEAEAEPEAAPPRRVGRLMGAAILLLTGFAIAAFFFSEATKTAGLRRGPLIAVAPFSLSSDKGGKTYIGAGLQSETAAALADYDWLTVVPLEPDEAAEIDAANGQSAADYLLRVNLRVIGEAAAATVLLLDGKSRGVRWSKTYDLHLHASEFISMERDIASRIAIDLGHPFGVLARIERALLGHEPPPSDAVYDCKLRALKYWQMRRRADYPPARGCFEALTGKASLDPDAMAALALLLIDARVERFEQGYDAARAAQLALESRDADDTHLLPRIAFYNAALCAGNVAAFRREGAAMVRERPNHPLALADYGAKLVLGGEDAAEGLQLLERARVISGNLMPANAQAQAAQALRRGESPDLAELRGAAQDSDALGVALFYFAAASARKDAGETARALQRLKELGVEGKEQIGAALAAQCWSGETRALVAKYSGSHS